MKNKGYAQRTFDEALLYLRNHGFELQDDPRTHARTTLTKYGCSATIGHNDRGQPTILEYPGVIFGGEVGKLVDGGFQKFIENSKTHRAATADDLRALHMFTEEMKEAMGVVSLYNESLGTVSESYMYDRVRGRDEAERKPRPWDKMGKQGA